MFLFFIAGFFFFLSFFVLDVNRLDLLFVWSVEVVQTHDKIISLNL